MPWLKLKKGTRAQYKVASKSVYVISVELLDNTTLECTLTAESTGKQALLSMQPWRRLLLFKSSCWIVRDGWPMKIIFKKRSDAHSSLLLLSFPSSSSFFSKLDLLRFRPQYGAKEDEEWKKVAYVEKIYFFSL